MAMMKSVQNNAHPFYSSPKSGNPDNPWDRGESAVSSFKIAQGDKDRDEESKENSRQPQATSKHDSWAVSVANGPANKVRVRLEPEEVFHMGVDVFQRRWVGRLRYSFECPLAVPVGDVEFSGSPFSNIDGDNAV